MSRRKNSSSKFSSAAKNENTSSFSIRLIIYFLFFISGGASLIYEILWTRQFVPVFGNSSYAISVVLAAFMAGLGLGSWWFGRFVDNTRWRLLLYSILEGGLAVCAFLIPLLLSFLKIIMPSLFSSLAESRLAMNIIRFVFSFIILFFPSFLIGGTLPVLSRFCIDQLKFVGHRLSLLYGLNTLGAAAGVFAAGFFLIESLGLAGTNQAAITINLFISVTMIILWLFYERKRQRTNPSLKKERESSTSAKIPQDGKLEEVKLKPLILSLAFITGCSSLSLEILWTRYLFFRIPSTPYSFSSILAVFLLSLGLGSLIYRLFFAHSSHQILILAFILSSLGPLILILLTISSKLTISYGLSLPSFIHLFPTSPLWEKFQSLSLSLVSIFLPGLFLGITFPTLCSVFTQNIKKVGQSIGQVYAVNTVGSIAGSFLPVFFLIPLLGIRLSFLFTAILLAAAGFSLFYIVIRKSKPIRIIQMSTAFLVLILIMPFLIPKNITQQLFLSTLQLGKHNSILFYQEGRTATSIVIQDKVSGLKDLYINSVEEVPTSYAPQYCFKLMGILGVLLHPQPSSVLMICFGGGIAAGTTIQHPQVKSLEVVDIEESIIKAARLLAQENNNLLLNEKVKIIIEDGRNYLFMSRKKYPLIVSDSTHPKSADSWVLYTRQFYQAVKNSLTENGVFVQWLPFHRMTTSEYKIILKTFQSVFPHTSLWLTHAFDEMGRFMKFSLVVATPRPLSIDFKSLQKKLLYPSVQKDLFYWNLNHPLGILENFLCGEQKIKEWTKDVPLNTDNLPWSYYTTKYSKGEKYSLQDFLPVAENVWPYLKNTGGQEESQKLKEQLNLLFQRKKLFMALKFKEAFDLLPQEKKALQEKKNIKASLRYLKEVAKFYSNDAKRLLWLARSMRTLINIQKGTPQEKEDVIHLLQQAVQTDPNFYETHLELADLLLKKGKRSEAALHYEKVLELKSDSFIALMMLGNIRGEEGKLDEAAHYFLQAIKVDPTNPSPHHNLATIFIVQKKIDEAVQHLEQALALNPQNPDIHNTLGAALLKKEKIDEALIHFKQALKIQPDFWKAMINLAQAEIQKGNLAQAIDILYKALQIKPNDEQSRYILAVSLARQNRFSEAIKILKEGLQFFPNKVNMLTLLVKLLLIVPDRKLEDRQYALSLAQRACLLTEEKNPECLDILASAYASLGNFQQAAKTARKAYNLALSLSQKQLAENIKKRLDFFESLR